MEFLDNACPQNVEILVASLRCSLDQHCWPVFCSWCLCTYHQLSILARLKMLDKIAVYMSEYSISLKDGNE